MTISVKLDPTVFDPGGVFEGTPHSRAVVHIGSGRNDLFMGKLPGPHPPGSLSWRGGQTYLQIGYAGSQFDDQQFEYIMQESHYRASVGAQLLYLLQRGIILVEKDGVTQTVTDVFTFTA